MPTPPPLESYPDDQVEHPDEGTGPTDPTAIDLVLDSVGRLVGLVESSLQGGDPKINRLDLRAGLLDLLSSYATYLYDQQQQENPDAPD